MKHLAFLLYTLIVLTSCKKTLIVTEISELSGVTYHQNVNVDGHQFDHLIIEDCIFDGGNLSIGNVNGLIIRNCIFKNIKDNGLKVGFIGPAEGIEIENCTFDNIGFNAIDSHEDAPNCTIENCSFKNVALSEQGAAMGQPHHGIYWKGKNVTISSNYFDAAGQRFGNSISVRSSGHINGNIIINSPKNGIMYYADHPGGDSLLIENNFLSNNSFSISAVSAGVSSWHNAAVIIRFNSIYQKENYSIYIADAFQTTSIVSIYGNLIVNAEQDFFKTFYELDTVYANFLSNSAAHYMNTETGNLHLKAGSEAVDYCSGLLEFPTIDIDGELRFEDQLNAGADE